MQQKQRSNVRKIKKEETNDIVQYLIPQIVEVGIPIQKCKIDVTTEKSGHKRGDIWISLKKQGDKDFEENIVCLIEAKHKKTTIGDPDWREAMSHGKIKSHNQGLNYYVVTNCKSEFRFYNSITEEEISLDGKVLTKLVLLDILQKIQTQTSAEKSDVVHKSEIVAPRISQMQFTHTLRNLADIYRSAGLKKGDERIDPTISFVVLKFISEKEQNKRTLNQVIKLWNSLYNVAFGKEVGDLKIAFNNMIEMIWGKQSQYKNNEYKDFKDLVKFKDDKLKDEHFKKIYKELDNYHFHGANFDLFGAIYEEFASQIKKKEFGEFYTRPHITGVIARLRLLNEKIPRDLKICDPACGSGGFLTGAYLTLVRNYSTSNRLDETVLKKLKKEIFWGFDNDEKSVARTKLNMFLVGDGHVHIYEIEDSLKDGQTPGYEDKIFDYVLTNPPMGLYEGTAQIGDFSFTNERRFELLFVEKVIRITKFGGEIAIVVNDGVLETPSRSDFRRKLLESCTIHAIISLTRYAFAPYTKEKTYVLFMQKKHEDLAGTIQKEPIWHFILDFDGYANSDKRYRTKYHDDLPELEQKFEGAVSLEHLFVADNEAFHQQRHNFERAINQREEYEGLSGGKYGYVEMKNVNIQNFYNLLSEFHLRPYATKKITSIQFEKELIEIRKDLDNILKKYDSKYVIQGGVTHFLGSNSFLLYNHLKNLLSIICLVLCVPIHL